MRLDNRSRSIVVSGDQQSEEAQQSIREWYESNGGNVAVNEDVGFVVTYPNREMAEKVGDCSVHQGEELTVQVLALGTAQIPNVNGGIKAAWHNEASATTHAPDVEMTEDQRRGDREEDE